jgi:hypothetical protein
MNKPNSINNPLVKHGCALKIETIFEETIEEQTISFHEFVRRIVW